MNGLKRIIVLLIIVNISIFSVFASYYNKGFHFLLDIAPKFNYIEMISNNDENDSSNIDVLKYAQCQIDVDLIGEYMFNEWAGLNIKLSLSFDAATTKYMFTEFRNRYSLYSKIGPRFYLCSFVFVDVDFVVGRAAYFSNGASYMMLGCDASVGFEIVRLPFFTFALRPSFSYRRGSYSNEFAAGMYCSFSL